jgi:hypothetical protein
MTVIYEDVVAQCYSEAIDRDGKRLGILLARQTPPFQGFVLIFNEATEVEIAALTKELNRLGLNQVRIS